MQKKPLFCPASLNTFQILPVLLPCHVAEHEQLPCQDDL